MSMKKELCKSTRQTGKRPCYQNKKYVQKQGATGIRIINAKQHLFLYVSISIILLIPRRAVDDTDVLGNQKCVMKRPVFLCW